MRTKRIVGLLLAVMLLVASAGPAMAEESIRGTISAKGDLIVLDADDGTYVLEGSDRARDMIGKKVNVTGTVAEKDDLLVSVEIALTGRVESR